jgi:hypothetical protein
MKIYKVKVRNNKRAETIKAKSELEAKVLFCEKKGLNYSLFASKIEVLDKASQTRRDN